MTLRLLEQFLAEECTPHVRDLICSGIESARSGVGPRSHRFEFNRFEVTFDLDEGDVMLEDNLEMVEPAMQRIPVADFLQALKAKTD